MSLIWWAQALQAVDLRRLSMCELHFCSVMASYRLVRLELDQHILTWYVQVLTDGFGDTGDNVVPQQMFLEVAAERVAFMRFAVHHPSSVK